MSAAHLPAVQRLSPEAPTRHAYVTGCGCEGCAAERAPRALAAPEPMPLCCNKPPPGCGYCFYCLARTPTTHPRKRPRR